MIFIAFGLAVFAGDPVYLDCTAQDRERTIAFEITVDEQAQKMTVAIPATGYAERLPAVFNAKTVSASKPIGGSTLLYEISRVDLKFRRSVAGSTAGISGTCVVQQTPQRAF